VRGFVAANYVIWRGDSFGLVPVAMAAKASKSISAVTPAASSAITNGYGPHSIVFMAVIVAWWGIQYGIA
jgi:hypothetical protein